MSGMRERLRRESTWLILLAGGALLAFAATYVLGADLFVWTDARNELCGRCFGRPLRCRNLIGARTASVTSTGCTMLREAIRRSAVKMA